MPTEAEVEELARELSSLWMNGTSVLQAWKAVARHVLTSAPQLPPTAALARALYWCRNPDTYSRPDHELPDQVQEIWSDAAERLKAWVKEQGT